MGKPRAIWWWYLTQDRWIDEVWDSQGWGPERGIDQSPVKGHLGTIGKGKLGEWSLWCTGRDHGKHSKPGAQALWWTRRQFLTPTQSSLHHHLYQDPRQGFLIWESVGETLEFGAGPGQQDPSDPAGLDQSWISASSLSWHGPRVVVISLPIQLYTGTLHFVCSGQPLARLLGWPYFCCSNQRSPSSLAKGEHSISLTWACMEAMLLSTYQGWGIIWSFVTKSVVQGPATLM